MRLSDAGGSEKRSPTIASNERRLIRAVFGCNQATRYTAIMLPTSDQLWDAIVRIYNEDGTADKMILPAVIAKLIEFKMAELNSIGLPQLTEYGEKCYLTLESGDDSMTEIDDMAALEDQQRR